MQDCENVREMFTLIILKDITFKHRLIMVKHFCYFFSILHLKDNNIKLFVIK